MFTSSVACAWTWTEPPMFPNAITGWPSFITNAGMIVWNGRLRGPTTLTDFESSVNSAPRLCSRKP